MSQNAQDIMNVLETWAAEKQTITPSLFLEAAQKLVALLGNEADLLYTMEQNIAQMRVDLLDKGLKSVEVKIRVEASEEYRLARLQRALIERINETVRLAKLRGKLASEELRNQV